MTKLVLNLLLIPNIIGAQPGTFTYYLVGINGAAIGSVMCHLIACVINYFVLRKTIKLDINFSQMIIKPFIATIIMSVVACFSQSYLTTLLGRPNVATLISIVIAVLTYILVLVVLKIFNREDYHMLPYGDKIYNFFHKNKKFHAE